MVFNKNIGDLCVTCQEITLILKLTEKLSNLNEEPGLTSNQDLLNVTFYFCFEKCDCSDNINLLEQLPTCETVIIYYLIVVACKAMGASALKNAEVSFNMFSKLPFKFFISS